MNTPAAHASQQGYAGNFINNAPPLLSHAMGTGDNFSNNAPPPLSHATMGTGDNFSNNAPPPLSHATMGTVDNFSNNAPAQALAMYHNGGEFVNASGYTTQWPAQQQIQSASSSQQSHSGIEQLHYLSDVEDAQLQLRGNWSTLHDSTSIF
jgi:hypothetical protein